VSFTYFISDTVARYIVEAVNLIAEYGRLLLPDYRFDPASGLWHHRTGLVEPPLRLDQLRYGADGVLRYPARHEQAPESALAGYLDAARALFAKLADRAPAVPDQRIGDRISARFEDLRWFELPAECLTD
jgi:hypothetical protein